MFLAKNAEDLPMPMTLLHLKGLGGHSIGAYRETTVTKVRVRSGKIGKDGKYLVFDLL